MKPIEVFSYNYNDVSELMEEERNPRVSPEVEEAEIMVKNSGPLILEPKTPFK